MPTINPNEYYAPNYLPKINAVLDPMGGLAQPARLVGTANHSLTAFVGVTGGSSTNTDGVLAVQGDIVLLTAQTVPAQNGPYVVGVVAGGVAPLTRPNWYASASTQFTGQIIGVGGEGTVFKNTSWKAMIAAQNYVVDTTDGKWYPGVVRGQTALVAGTFTISTVPIFSATQSILDVIRTTANTCTATTGGYVTNGAMTPGVIGTASCVVMAAVAAGTINNADISTLNWSIQNW